MFKCSLTKWNGRVDFFPQEMLGILHSILWLLFIFLNSLLYVAHVDAYIFAAADSLWHVHQNAINTLDEKCSE